MKNDGRKVSVVVLTKNSGATVRKSLESILRQTHKPDEVIVVDGGSTDGTLEIVRQYPFKLVQEPGLGFGHARNLGVKTAQGDIVFFIDSDCYAEPRWIEKILPHFKDSEIAGVTGVTRLWNTNDAVARFLAFVKGRMETSTQRTFVKLAPTMNLALRRKVILQVGGFDETLIRCEDTELTYKVTQRYKILYEPEAVVWFKGSPTLGVASRKCIRHFTGVGQLFAKHGFNRLFLRLDLPIRGFVLIAAIVSLFLTPWYVPTLLFGCFVTDFLYKTVKMYRRYRDWCVVYYIVFFTFWSVASLAVFYGLYRGLKQKWIHWRKGRF
ncbi:MAG: glycosyltransferase [Candidatus Bathyarchaeia archaeon]